MKSWVCGLAGLVFAASAAMASETITYSYDANGHLVGTAHSGTVNNGTVSCYVYDEAHNRRVVLVMTGGASCVEGSAAEGLTLGPNISLYSYDAGHQLIQQSDGNLVIYNLNTGAATWSSATSGSGATHTAFQGDGNLVVYTAAGRAVWASNTSGNTNATLNMQNDGNLVIYSSAGKVLWASNTSGK